MRALPLILGAVSSVTYTPIAHGQAPTTRTLSRPEIEYTDPFTRISGVRELRDGRVIVSDMQERSVMLLDLARQTGKRIGREGQGPGEYQFPTGVHAFPGDTTLIADMNGRYLKISPTGDPAGQFDALPSQGGRGGMMFNIGGAAFVDRTGRVYTSGGAGQSFQITDRGPVYADSLPILRRDLVRGRADTAAFIPAPKNKPQVTSPSNGNISVAVRQTPFDPRDIWAVAPDGRIAIVYVGDYHVEWVSPTGQRTRGVPIPYERLRVTEADKKAYREGRGRQAISVIADDGGGGRARVQTGQAALPPGGVPEPEWPEFRPPFTAATVTPTGELWVLRSRSADNLVPTYDVFDGNGRMTGKVTLPERTSLVGFGTGTVYLVRTDADDLQYLQKYRM